MDLKVRLSIVFILPDAASHGILGAGGKMNR
jgi:hypothetical protein